MSINRGCGHPRLPDSVHCGNSDCLNFREICPRHRIVPALGAKCTLKTGNADVLNRLRKDTKRMYQNILDLLGPAGEEALHDFAEAVWNEGEEEGYTSG